jgi:hypothetical protein
MDFVYVCRSGDNEELRYSIRSVLSSFPDANIWVVGGKPNWYSGNFIASEKANDSYSQVRENLREIISSPEISESFVLMNDDFFIVKPITEIKTYHAGPLEESIKRLSNMLRDVSFNNPYMNKLSKTDKKLRNRGVSRPLNYELHVPMQMEKSKLAPIIDQYVLWRSPYGNLTGIGGEFMNDVKVYSHPKYEGRSHDYLNCDCSYLSTEDEAFKTIEKYLHNLFPTPSKYELDMQ